LNAKPEGNGSKEAPFLRIGEAAAIASPGDTVLVAPGIYRESVHPVNAGTESERITYKSEKPLGAVITGADVAGDWTLYQGNVWKTKISNACFGDYNPYTTYVCGDWYFAPTIRHTGAVFINDLMMYETATLDECIEGAVDPHSWVPEESVYKWFTEQDGDSTILYANFQGKDPNNEKVEISVRRNCFMPEENGINYITVSGFVITKGATTWAPPAAYQDGLIGPHWSKGWIIEDCEVSNSRCCGISLGKYRDEENDMYFYTRHVKSPTQMERDAVCRGQYHGWLKENIGSHLIRRCHVHHCEQTGIVGRMGAVFSTIEDCHIHHICNSQQLGGAETAGIKLHAAIDVTIRRNHIHNCIMGVWLDWEAQGARVSQNLLYANQRPKNAEPAAGAMFSNDVFIEVGHGPTLIDNNIMMSEVSCVMPSEGLAFVHNLMLGSISYLNAGVDSVENGQREPRYTPYHIRHRTEVAGFMTILHGDDRVYNNIMIQTYPIDETKTPQNFDYNHAGTAGFDIFPDYEEWISHFMMDTEPDMGALAKYHFGHLPVWIDGNAYFNGANVYSKEKHNFVNSADKAFFELTPAEDGSFTLNTNIYDLMGDFTVEMIDSDVLGKAFEPEQRFENPDGSSIRFDTDYFGNKRTGKILPGPFAKPGQM
ncbi:MAG: right-handed parallel beta-helix repeat-containing protein, partial [Lachnospiraceae bacterium]|nr:right-handed parallel beta-helix repeat-containing protein [Lachnospiraceae bacterium]